jgi:hypothetical protein
VKNYGSPAWASVLQWDLYVKKSALVSSLPAELKCEIDGTMFFTDCITDYFSVSKAGELCCQNEVDNRFCDIKQDIITFPVCAFIAYFVSKFILLPSTRHSLDKLNQPSGGSNDFCMVQQVST